MEAGLNLYSVRNLIATEESFLDTAKKLKEMGYSYLQFSGAPFDAPMIKRVMDKVGLPIVLTHVPMDRITDDTDTLMREHESIGCRNIGLGMMPRDTIADAVVFEEKLEALERTAEYMEKNGFRFFYHHHHFEFLKRNGKTLLEHMIETAPHINFTADTYWLQYGGADICTMLDKLNGRILCTHLKDYGITAFEKEDGKADFKPIFVPVGDGTLDFAKIVTKMRECGAKYFLVEQDNAALLSDTLEEVERSIKYIKNYL